MAKSKINEKHSLNIEGVLNLTALTLDVEEFARTLVASAMS